MALSNNGNDMVMPVSPMMGGYSNGGFGYGDGYMMWLILILFVLMGNGYGFGGFGGGNQMPYIMNNTQNDVQRGFDQQAVMGGINGITTALSNAEVSRCNTQANLLQTLNANQTANSTAMNTLAMSLQNCCCENRAGIADLKYTIATEACADRQAVTDALRELETVISNGNQTILNQMCQDKMDAMNETIANLRSQLSMKDLQASQTAQTAQLQAAVSANAQMLEQNLNPVPRPAYVVQNPNCCAPAYSTCGCNA